ncbi:VWA domain-containing protein [Sphaerisporangium album]|uniref:VWA domain-containing protein n=1 Tax=Sphaerisporangium album TaxID=509200 RepID=A0A367FSL2_9ACTN|nr:vWA domain-containing protein [Sphaerisporangium album]RCG32667.1 VWA domain-containing protein [Sphaerisporangium album]
MTTGQQHTGNLRYAVDIVLCIDVTESMSPVLDTVKESALSFHERLEAVMTRAGKAISQLRLKVIGFRDFADRAEDAIEESDFFLFPGQAGEFERFMRRLEATGGGDFPESGLEALALAINAPWEKGLDRRRHVIVLFTDAPAHPIGMPEAMAAHTYPMHLPRTMDELFEEWGYASSATAVMEHSAKRLVLFAPDVEPWTSITDEWSLTMQFPSKAGEGLQDVEMDEIINTIVHSL